MIAFVSGTIFSLTAESMIVLVQGIGYRVYVPGRMLEAARTGAEVSLYTHHHLREDAAELFGFVEVEEYQLFTQLLKVSGVGPKMALAILSAYTPEMIREAIVHQDVGVLTSISGVGKKTAERIVLELKDSTEFLKGVVSQVAESGVADAENGKAMQSPAGGAGETLIALGYSHAEVAAVLGKIDRSEPLEEQVRQALKLLSQ